MMVLTVITDLTVEDKLCGVIRTKTIVVARHIVQIFMMKVDLSVRTNSVARRWARRNGEKLGKAARTWATARQRRIGVGVGEVKM